MPFLLSLALTESDTAAVPPTIQTLLIPPAFMAETTLLSIELLPLVRNMGMRLA